MPQTPRRRGVWHVAVPAVAALAGLLFATSSQTAKGVDLRGVGDLPTLVREQSARVQARSNQAAQLQSQIDALTAAQAPGNSAIAALTTRAQQIAPAAGTRAVSGPSVTVSLDDAHVSIDSLPPQYGPDDIVVHQQDVQAVVNALWHGGAQAMMIQDQRVIATSAVRCVGNTLILQGRVYSPPYVIAAIGDPAELRRALRDDPQVAIYRTWVTAVGLGYSVSEGTASMPAYAGQVGLTWASVAA